MKLEQIQSGDWVAVLRSERGERRINLKVKDRAVADELVQQHELAKVERLAISGLLTRSLIRQMTVTGRVLVGDAIEKWAEWLKSTSESANTAVNMKCYALAWMRDTHCRKCGIDEIVEDDLDRWVNKKDGRKANTRKFRLAVLRSLFWFAKEKQYRDDNPALMVSMRYKDLDHHLKEVRPKRLFTDEEYQKLFNWLQTEVDRLHQTKSDFERDYRFWLAAVAIGRHSALRLGDIAALQRASIGERFVVHTDKRNTRISHEITPELRVALDLIPKSNSKWCFPKQAVMEADPRLRAQLPVQFGRILKRAGIQSHHFHELRATKLSELSTAGIPIAKIAGFAGHSSEKTTAGYIINDQAQARRAESVDCK